MIRNADTPAMPSEAEISNSDEVWAFQVGDNSKFKFPGLTKREMFAMNAMQAILSNGASEEIGYTDWDKNLANHAITAADALLKELDK